MRKVIKHGKYGQEEETNNIPYVKCPECGTKIYYRVGFPMVVICKCECEFSFDDEDIEWL
jgi:DNA-directed RNA polymerase subunit RPC12/RpoP